MGFRISTGRLSRALIFLNALSVAPMLDYKTSSQTADGTIRVKRFVCVWRIGRLFDPFKNPAQKHGSW